MWENGKKYFDKTDIADLPATYKRNRKEIDIVSAGWVCRYSKVFKTILIASVVFIPFVKMTLYQPCGFAILKLILPFSLYRCAHKTGATPMMSIHGKVFRSDIQRSFLDPSGGKSVARISRKKHNF